MTYLKISLNSLLASDFMFNLLAYERPQEALFREGAH